MTYIVLARKYRPQKFDEVVGQEHITQLLTGAIEADRLTHAYLFCGPRGVGKTSCARILAKSLNCKNGPTLSPCGSCPSCREIANTTSFDVIEIDGASNRGIDEVRTLRENVKFAPSYGRYKIYIVDEVHMLTAEAFNALLKTLEEPPAHVKFIFATTAPHKIPATIISRCQRFDFKRVSVNTMIDILSKISAREKLSVDKEAFYAIAKAASGSLRDALSILDQLGSIAGRGINVQDVTSMLGMVETALLFELTDCLAQKNCAQALKVLDTIVSEGKDIKQFNRDIVEHFRNLMIIKIGGKALGGLVDYPVVTKEMLLTQAQKFTLEEILAAIEIFLEAQETARLMDSMRIPLEVAFAKLSQGSEIKTGQGNPQVTRTESKSLPADSAKRFESSGAPVATNKIPAQKIAVVRPSAMSILTNQKGHVDFSAGEASPNQDEAIKEDAYSEAAKESDVTLQELTLQDIGKIWDAVTSAISRHKMSVATYLQEGSPYAIKGATLTIGFSPEASFHKETLEEKDNRGLVEKIFCEKSGCPIKIEFKIVEDRKPQEQEPFVKTALETFNGKVVSRWQQGI